MGKKNTLVRYAKHWDELSFSSHIMMDALAKHLLGLAAYGMTDTGEVLESFCQLRDTSGETWIAIWGKLAQRLTEMAQAKEKQKNMVSAASLYLRASTYWRTAPEKGLKSLCV